MRPVMPGIDEIMIAPPDGDLPIDPMSWFDSPGPFELEIGSGKGGFLLHRARARPQVRLLGIEWANKFYRYSADRMARWNVPNVRIMRTDARRFVLRNLPAECLSVLHLYHPDPWPKQRHHKRRLIQADFVEAIARALRPDGRWRIQTDHEGYFQWMRGVLRGCLALVELPWERLYDNEASGWQGTNFEVKYLKEGRQIFRTVYAPSGAPDRNR